MERPIFDLIVLGAGPAGITAAVYGARKKMATLVVTGDIGGQAAWSGDIENYTGYQFISGPELAAKFEEHMKKYAITVKENEFAQDITKDGRTIKVRTDKNAYESKALIIASGKRSKELNVPGEKEFKNRGLSYCATCDGPLFSGKKVAVIGGGNSALDASLGLIKIADHVYIIDVNPRLGGDVILREKVENSDKVTIFNNAQVKAITGSSMVKGIDIINAEGQKSLAVEGVFVEIGLAPNSDFAKNVDKNSLSEIKINSNNETSVSGIFAAGDVTDVQEKQIIIAAGEGAKAALSAFKYVNQNW